MRFLLLLVKRQPFSYGVIADSVFSPGTAVPQIAPDRQAFLQLARELAQRLLSGNKLLIHCGGGIGRSGTLAIGLLIALGMGAENQDVIIFEVRPRWDKPMEQTWSPVAKLKFIRNRNIWRPFWQRADTKWHKYEPFESSKDLGALIKEIDSDPHGCFFG